MTVSITRGITFGSTETVTNTKLHNLVDLATISGIQNSEIAADAAIADTKLADISTGNKVSGSALFNLSSLPSTAGQLRAFHLSLSSIPNVDLLPLTRVSWVDGIAMRNLASLPTTQLVPYNLLVSSLASGSLPQYNGAFNYTGFVPPMPPYSDANADEFDESTWSGTKTISSTSYTKLLEFGPMVRFGNINIRWTFNKSASNDVVTRVYINDIAVGSEFDSGDATNVNEDHTVGVGDLVQIYGRQKVAGQSGTVSSAEIRCDNPTVPQQVL